MSILATGASGFVGRAFCERMCREGRGIRGVIRRGNKLPHNVPTSEIHTIDADTDWTEALLGIDQIVHLAARVHVMRDDSANPLAEFRSVNVDGTLNLARQAVAAGVRRFIYVSSIKVNGEMTQPGQPFKPNDAPLPQDAYGQSKHEAEQGLWRLAADTDLEVVVVRPPLVYGPGVKANFASMIRWVARGVPLPLGAVVHNRRSLIALDNLVDLLAVCLTHPDAAGQTFLASDGEDMSTAELLARLSRALGKSPNLVSVPPSLLNWGAKLLGKGNVARRLLGSLQVDISKTRTLLKWQPPVSVDEALRRMVAGQIA